MTTPLTVIAAGVAAAATAVVVAAAAARERREGLASVVDDANTEPGGKCNDDEPVFDPPLPWAAGPTGWAGQYERNKRVVAAMNASGECFDFVLYGDSITAFLGDNPAVFRRHFGDLRAAALGVNGNTVEQLAWRITRGNERPARAPRVIALLIGTNNARQGTFDPTRVERLLRWLKRAYPTSILILWGLLPRTRIAVGPLNEQYRAVARRAGAVFVLCGQVLRPEDRAAYSDGLHPTAGGHDHNLACLRRVVDTLL